MIPRLLSWLRDIARRVMLYTIYIYIGVVLMTKREDDNVRGRQSGNNNSNIYGVYM